MVVFFNVESCNGQRKETKKGGDSEAHKQNVASSEQTIRKQNVDPLQPGLGEQIVTPSELRLGEQIVISSELGIDESNNLCGLELIMVIVCNSNDEITPNTY